VQDKYLGILRKNLAKLAKSAARKNKNRTYDDKTSGNV